MPDYLKLGLCTIGLVFIKLAEVGLIAVMVPILWKWARKVIGG